MKKKNESEALKEAIHLLKVKQAGELLLLKEQFQETYESLKPLNFIKNTFNEVTSSPEIKNGLINNAIGLATGYLSKKVLIGATHNPFKKILGAILEFSVASFVAKRANIQTSNEEEITQQKNGHEKII